MRARTSFLVDDQVEAGAVRDTILASWTRSREWDIDYRQRRAVGRVRPRAGLAAGQGGRADHGRRRRPVRGRAGQRDPHRRRRGRAGAAHRRLHAQPAPGQGLARPRLLLRRAVRRHQRDRHRAGGPRTGPGLRARALRRAAGRPRVRRRPDLAPDQRQAARRRRPHLLAPRRRALHGGGRRADRAPDRGGAARPVRAARARAAARLPERLPAGPRRRLRRQPRRRDDERPRSGADRPHRPGHADRRGDRGDELRAATPDDRPAERRRRTRAVQAELDRPRHHRRCAPRPARGAGHPAPAHAHRADDLVAGGGGRLRAAVDQVLPGRRPALPEPRVAGAGGRGRHRQGHPRPGHPPVPARPPHICGCSTPTTTARAGSPRSSRSWRPEPAARSCSPTSTGSRPTACSRSPTRWNRTGSPPTTSACGWSPPSGPAGWPRATTPRTCSSSSRARSRCRRCAITSRTSPSSSRSCSPG